MDAMLEVDAGNLWLADLAAERLGIDTETVIERTGGDLGEIAALLERHACELPFAPWTAWARGAEMEG